MSLRKALLCGVLALAGCADTGGGDDTLVNPPDGSCGAAPDAGPGPVSCPVTLRVALGRPATQVYVAGEWNHFDRNAQRMEGPKEDGAYVLALSLPPGVHGYKLVVDGDWQLDPAHGYRKYVDGVENSGLRVSDCRRPALQLGKDGVQLSRPAAGQGRFSASFGISLGQAQRPLCALRGTLRRPADHAGAGYRPRALSANELHLAADQKSGQLALSGLPDGKYTVSLQAESPDGASETLLLPFWVEATPFRITDTPLYMLMTDRFRDGDPGNDPRPIDGVEPAADYFGGDLAGVEQAIREGYFDEHGLNTRALWVTPWQTQTAGRFRDASGQYWVSSYHGYWPVKAREVDPRLGGADALHRLVEEAHRHGMRVLMDAVLNHVHIEHEYFQDPQRRPWFRTGCICGTANCDWTEHRLDCLFADYMPDINWTVTAASEQFIADTLWWLEEFDLDGLRVDAVKHVEDLAIFNLTARVRERFEHAGTRYYTVGETAMGWIDGTVQDNRDQYNTISRYLGPQGLAGQFDFVLYHAVPYRVFARDGGPGRQFRHADFWTHASLEQFAGSDMVRYLGSHDTSRFVTLSSYRDQPGWPGGTAFNKWTDLPKPPPDQEPYDRLWLAMLNLMTVPGVPLLYYGDEYGEYGGGDPDNRHRMRFAGLDDREQAQLRRTTALLKARARLRGLSRGDLKTTALLQEDLYAYARPGLAPADGALVVLNLRATQQSAAVPVPPELGWSGGAALLDYLTGAEYAVAASSVMVTVPGRGGVVLGMK